ncbi:UNVERIFIED_CONTAM: hypothetical protein GTU68_000567 [Idotea baltica]|nr:hypothetical protein [Idotea baltica]
MKILITNDDGFDAPGLKALYDAVASLGDVTVVAPSVCHSSRGHAVEVKRNISVWPVDVDGIGKVHVVDSSPADCTRMALQVVCESVPDIVIAGINPGANLGVDVYYSGTVAAVREAAMAGLPGIAVSRYMKAGVPMLWDEISRFAKASIQRVMSEPLGSGEFWNVNLPAVSGEAIKDIAFVAHSTEQHHLNFQPVADNDGRIEYAFVGNYQGRPASQNADVRFIFDGYATATKIGLATSVDGAEPVTESFPNG